MKNNNIIGTDISLEVCKNEGYMMLDTQGDLHINPDKQYAVFSYYPKYLEEEFLKQNMQLGLKSINTTYSWKDALYKYNKYKTGIDSYADDMPDRMKKQTPSFYDLLIAVDVLAQYCGLD